MIGEMEFNRVLCAVTRILTLRRRSMVLKIDVSLEKQKCKQCGKSKTGCYKLSENENDQWICQDCVMNNIKKKK